MCPDEVCEADDDIGSEPTLETETDDGSPTPDLPPPPECEQDSDCSDSDKAPFCIAGTCQPCSSSPTPDLACAAQNPDQPLCHADECVACFGDNPGACAAQGQVCVAGETICGACTAHDQCPGEAACDILAGECFLPSTVWHVDGDGGRDFVSIGEALEHVQFIDATLIIHGLESGGAYYESIDHHGSEALALLAAPGEFPRIEGPASQPAISLGYSELYLRGLEIHTNGGIYVDNQGQLHMHDTKVYFVDGDEAIELYAGAGLTMRNSMLRGKVVVNDDAFFDVSYSTIYSGAWSPFYCSGAIAPSSLRNNLLATEEGAETILGCLEASMLARGNALSTGIPSKPDNTIIGPAQPGWFADLQPNLHLGPNIPLSVATAATWSADDPSVDIDGNPRSAEEGVQGWAGADVP
ncbi:MAG: hypothetical protein HC927_12305 [Deltaproteobacteria bacterium]|nr:hypothetical protein [Deltaproteobacteria bacterium]